MVQAEMWLQKAKGGSAKCRVCGERIKKGFRLICWSSRQGCAYFHIECIQKLGDILKNTDLDDLIAVRKPQYDQIRVDRL